MIVDPRYGVLRALRDELRRSAAGWTFVIAEVGLVGGWLQLEAPLLPVLRERRPDVMDRLPDDLSDAVWARARIEALFGVRCIPERERGEKSMMEFGFVAIADASPDAGYPFICTDRYGSGGLLFSAALPATVRAAIAAGFWQLLTGGDELAEYRDEMLHVGAGVLLTFGCEAGRLFLDETEPDDAEEAPSPGSPEALEEERAEQEAWDRSFLAGLGPEREGTRCHESGCERGAVRASLFCAVHHFAAVEGRPYPYSDE